MTRAILLFLLLSSAAHAQSLAEVARQTKAKAATKPAAKTFTNDDVATPKSQPSTNNTVDTTNRQNFLDAEVAVERIADLSPEELMYSVIGDTTFPYESKYWFRLYQQKERWVKAARAVADATRLLQSTTFEKEHAQRQATLDKLVADMQTQQSLYEALKEEILQKSEEANNH
jgi:hypothetical protein